MIPANMAEEEKQRLISLLFSCNVSETKIQLLEPIVENVAWMKVKLDDAREQIKKTSVAIPYDNGGGQKGIRENPLFKGYESLWKSYMSGMGHILDCLPPETQEQQPIAEKPKTVLEMVRNKHRA